MCTHFLTAQVEQLYEGWSQEIIFKYSCTVIYMCCQCVEADSLCASEEVRLSGRRVEESSVDLVFGETSAQVFQALGGVLLHAGLTEHPVSVSFTGTEEQGMKRRSSC